ncbi:MAG TPA: cyclic nucleotide-binding domain-containing protein [Candidatus Binatia bacterium]|nr:cyclic nucleotide-binding domain-containing protein [Candidatus Binatia bacterium]
MRLLANLSWVELSGYVASLLVFVAFYMKTMIPLRVVAILSNMAFITYAVGGHLYPVLILHSVLLPLNCIRLRQMRALVSKVHEASHAELSTESLIPFMTRKMMKKGDVVFEKGDLAKEMYLTLSGSIRLAGVGVLLGPGNLIGEIGIFSPHGQRMDTAICEADGELGVIADEKVLQLYHQNPTFGFYLVKLVTHRLLDDYSKSQSAGLNSAQC